MAINLESILQELSDIQRKAVEWNNGALLVLAGPGSGKTRVLTCRVARLLAESQDDRFRILALTFTNKAAHEMSNRVTTLAPGLEERADIQTFHGFCAQVLRQHGVHLGIKPDFGIYSQTSDRLAVLDDAVGRDLIHFDRVDRLLPVIDSLKARLVSPDQSERWISERKSISVDKARYIARAYRLYEEELYRANALDFNSLIFEVYRLFSFAAMARHYQSVYRYWLIDEFQDTNRGQYQLLRRMAGDKFRRIFAVADDDQTIYEWNGANVRRITTLVDDFDCEVVQLPTNFRCPPHIVDAANRLVVYNARREESKRLAEPANRSHSHYFQQIRCLVFETDEDEVTGVAKEIASLDITKRDQTLVIGRTRSLLESMHEALETERVQATILMRRDDFLSPKLRWLVACLKQINRPLDHRNLSTLVETFSSFSSVSVDYDELLSRAEAEGVTYLTVWTDVVRATDLTSPASDVVDVVSTLTTSPTRFYESINQILDLFDNEEPDDDFKEDLSAWRRIGREIRGIQGAESLDRFLQELELRSKEPVQAPGSVSLATIHSAKGLEFDTVYLIGLAEEILPSWHSVKQDASSAKLEEERRGCFVAITRTKQHLILSRANRYMGWDKQPSRFLSEMGLLNTDSDSALP